MNAAGRYRTWPSGRRSRGGAGLRDETGDVVTNSPGPGVWYDRDFYFVTRGEGVLVKRNFEA